MKQKNRSPLLLMALTILIDITGFGLIIPLLPFLAKQLGANAEGVALASAIYAFAQFLFTPLLGALSDRYGRKPIIILSLLIESVSLVLTSLAVSFPMLLIARFVGGLGASNIGSAQAVVSDVTAPEDRAKGMGLIGASIGLGFVIGPAMGGVLSLSGKAIPFYIAAGVALLNALLVLVLLPETRGKHKGEAGSQFRASHSGIEVLFAGWRYAFRYHIITRLALVNLLFTIAFTAMETVFPLFAQANFGWGATQVGYVFTYVGILVVIMQGGMVRQLVKRFSEQKVMLGGLFLLAAGLVMLAFSKQLALLLISLGILSIGEGAVTPTISTLLSFAAPAEAQGETLGLAQGMGGLGRIIGPLLAGWVFLYNPAIPFITGGILVVLAALLALPILPDIQRPARVDTEATTGQTVHI